MSAHGIPLPEILEAVEVARERGWTIEQGAWIDRINGVNCCCPLGACMIQRDMNQGPLDLGDGMGFVAETLGIDPVWTEGFADGFDGNKRAPSPMALRKQDVYNDGHAAGREARAALKFDGGES